MQSACDLSYCEAALKPEDDVLVDGGVINDGAAVLDFQLVRVLHHKLLAAHILHFVLGPLELDLHGALESVFDF